MVDLELRLLGPLEGWFRGRPVPLGGKKQRAVLAALLLERGRVVAVERLIDAVWGEDPPASAGHTLEAYVSRLRAALGVCGVVIERRGAGYRIDAGDASIDASAFEELHEAASTAAAAGNHRRAAELAARALALWRGPALADVELPGGAAEVERLEGLRIAALAQRLEADLELGRHEEVVGELEGLVRDEPYRERFVALLMLALYRSGRQADALQVYEQTRARLARDLGVRPSEELRALSGEIVRQAERLRVALRAGRRVRAPAVRGFVVGIATVAVLAATAGATVAVGEDVGSSAAAVRMQRVAVVLAGGEAGLDRDVDLAQAAAAYARASKLGPELFAAGELERALRTARAGGFALVVAVGEPAAVRAFAPAARRRPATRFVFLGASLADVGLSGVPNATGVRFADEQASHLAGYLSALLRPRIGARRELVDVVAAVVGPPTARTRLVVEGFRSGAKRARRSVDVHVAYAPDVSDRTACERLANDRIDAGADVIFAAMGACGRAAVAVARTRGVWAIGELDLGAAPGPQLVGAVYRDWRRALWDVFARSSQGTLPGGGDVVLGLNDDYAVGLDRSSGQVPEAVWSRVVERCSVLRQQASSADA